MAQEDVGDQMAVFRERQILWTEDNFTEARPDCPYPQRWHAQDPDSTEVEVTELVAAFVRALQPDVVIETGSAFGDTTQKIGFALRQNGQGRLYSFEPDGDRARVARDRCVAMPVTILESESICDWIPPGQIGFAWFDSLIDLRIPEYLHYRAWMERGTIVGFHDCGWGRREFRGDLEIMAARGYFRLIMPHTPRGVAFAQVL